MSFFSIVLIAIAVAVDAFAAAVAFGLTKTITLKEALIISLYFGGFQSLMAFLGWFLCTFFRTTIQAYDHWIAFVLLSAIALNMFCHGKEKNQKVFTTDFLSISLISLATSIDSLATGVSFSVLSVNIFHPIIIIGCITFLISFLGVYLGKQLKGIIHNESKLYYLSGCILLIIAFKILSDHL